MYLWRKLTEDERAQRLAHRQAAGRPWHGPPRLGHGEHRLFHLTAACYEHAPLAGFNIPRLEAFTQALHAALDGACKEVFGWCVLPNHYHLLVETWNLRETTRLLGRLHGRTSQAWNQEEGAPGRTCFHRVADRAIRGDRHFWATLNYIHHNPVHHGLVPRWMDWPWSSAAAFLERVGRGEAARIWGEYPIRDYGAAWDAPGGAVAGKTSTVHSG